MAIGFSTPNREFTRHRHTLFPGRELPPPRPVPRVMANNNNSGSSISSNPTEREVLELLDSLNDSSMFFPSELPANLPPAADIRAYVVWILNCKHCGKFITNRGMKSGLLLRPDVRMFSTDAMPVNCSVYEGSTDPSRSRTCECLTQTLCCHGCGTAIGYMTVSPCARCAPGFTYNSSAPFAPPRFTNGHRFMFHASEFTYEERLHVAGDPDVHPDARSQEVWAAISEQLPTTAHFHMSKVPMLSPGEILCWHHFSRSGDMLGGVYDDPRARASRGYRFDPLSGIYPNRRDRIIAGR